VNKVTPISAAHRVARRTIEVACPSWSETPVTLIEPTVRDYLLANKATDDQERAVILLGAAVLDDSGKPIGKEAILNASVAAFSELASHLPTLLSATKVKEGEEDPLAPKSNSSTDSPSPSEA